MFCVSGTSVQLPVRPESMAASAAYGFRPSFVDGRGAFVVRRAVGEENHRSGTARSAPGASGTLHPSNCPGGEHGLRFRPSLVDGRGAFAVRRAVGEEIHRSGTARSAPGARDTLGCALHPFNPPDDAHDFEPSSTDGREAFPRVAQPGKGIIAGESSGTRRARGIREVA